MRYKLALSLAGASCGVVLLAHAQEPPASDLQSNNVLEEIVVTAQKRAEPLQSVPLSVTALSGSALAAQNKTRMDEILQGVPGVQFEESAGGYVVDIRGVSNPNPGVSDQPNAIYTDGIYSQLDIENRAAFFDLNRVEVLRGPQGTLYGGNALGGAVNIITNDPDLTRLMAQGSVTAGSYDLLAGQGIVNVPVSETLGFRAVIATENSRGYLSDGQDDSVYSAGRFKLLYRPSDDLTVVLTAMYTKINGEGVGTVPPAYPASLNSRSDPWNSPNPLPVGKPSTLTTISSYRANIEWNAGIGILTFLPAFTDLRQEQVAAPFGPAVDLQFHHTRITDELRLASLPGAPIVWTVGAYYLHYENPFNIDILGPEPLSTGQLYNTVADSAGFGQVTLPVTSAFRVTGGARYTHGSQHELDFTGPAAGPAATDSYNATTWKAGVEADVRSRSMVYANVSTGFRAGGVQIGGGNPFVGIPPGTFAPEKLTAYAIGSKNELLGQRAVLNAEAFYYHFQNYQVADTLASVSGLQLAATTDISGVNEYGADLEFRLRATEADTLNLALDYLHGRFPDNSPSKFDISGTPLDHAPDWTVSLGYEHAWGLGNGGSLTAGADAAYVTREKIFFSNNCYAPGVPCESAAHHTSNAHVGYTSARDTWNVLAYVRNLENNVVITATSGPPLNSLNVAAPRTIGVQVTVKLDEPRQ